MSYTDKDIIKAVNSSISKAEALRKLNLVPAGGNYKTLSNHIERLELSTDHMKGQSWSKNKTIGPKREIEEYLSNNFKISSYNLKKRLFYENLKDRKCERCKRENWASKPIPLELHHIDGNSENNNFNNLEIICPNCHAQTNNYRGSKNKKPKTNRCVNCNRLICDSSKRCRSCAAKKREEFKINWPNVDWLARIVDEYSFSHLSRKLGVSDNAIRKHISNYS